MKNLKDLILKEFSRKKVLKSSDLTAKFKISRQAVNRHIRELIRGGKILKYGISRKNAAYVLNRACFRKKIFGVQKRFFRKVRAEGLTEERLLALIEAAPGLLDTLTSNAKNIFAYAFTEMANNAIEHSQTKFIAVTVCTDSNLASFIVGDAGVGIFENIRKKKNLGGEMEAIQDLLKGKTTTAPGEHSGEGIFFTSKVAGRFLIDSHEKRLIIDNNLADVFIEDRRFVRGTRVFFEIPANTVKDITEIFRQYTNEKFEFDKTRVAVRLFKTENTYISRSQARRLLHSLENFSEIILDFSDVKTVGQGFADEIFRVFQNAHPNVNIAAINASENVDFMIKRALSTKN